jgi:hypothetical protein
VKGRPKSGSHQVTKPVELGAGRSPVGLAAVGPGRVGLDDARIVEVAKQHATNGTRMVAALASRELGWPVNRKRVQREMRAQAVAADAGQRSAPPAGVLPGHAPRRALAPRHDQGVDRGARLGLPTRDRRLLHREIAGWNLKLRCRDDEAIATVEAAVRRRPFGPALAASPHEPTLRGRTPARRDDQGHIVRTIECLRSDVSQLPLWDRRRMTQRAGVPESICDVVPLRVDVPRLRIRFVLQSISACSGFARTAGGSRV